MLWLRWQANQVNLLKSLSKGLPMRKLRAASAHSFWPIFSIVLGYSGLPTCVEALVIRIVILSFLRGGCERRNLGQGVVEGDQFQVSLVWCLFHFKYFLADQVSAFNDLETQVTTLCQTYEPLPLSALVVGYCTLENNFWLQIKGRLQNPDGFPSPCFLSIFSSLSQSAWKYPCSYLDAQRHVKSLGGKRTQGGSVLCLGSCWDPILGPAVHTWSVVLFLFQGLCHLGREEAK